MIVLNRKDIHDRGGFTIVELLIVIVVIAILAAISLVSYRGTQERTRESALLAEISQMHKTIQVNTTLGGKPVSVSKPIAYIKEAGTQSFQKPLENTHDLAVYTVFDATGNTTATNWSSMARLYPNNANNSIAIRTGASGSNSGRGYFATSAQTNRDLTQAGVIDKPGRHVGWITANSSRIYSGYDAGSTSATLTSHTGWNFDSVTAFNHSNLSHVATVVFPGFHSESARAAVLAWLDNEYDIGL